MCSLIIAIVEYDQFLERIELINENIKYENLNKNTTGLSDKRNNNKLHTENNNSKILENKDSGELLKLNKIQMALHNLCHDVLILVFINNDMNNGNKCLTLGNLEWWNNDKINDFLNIIDLKRLSRNNINEYIIDQFKSVENEYLHNRISSTDGQKNWKKYT